MNIRLNSPNLYTAPNNKPKVAFGDNASCMQAMINFYKTNNSEENAIFRATAQTLEDRYQFIVDTLNFIKKNNPKPYFVKVVRRALGLKY